MSDPSNPDYYKKGSIECVDAIEASLTPEEFTGWCKGNAMKYLWRAGSKEGNPLAQDLMKADWYIRRACISYERNSTTTT